ncbi:TetR/AcrR family transcriptional regulator C-terminal ligand-binding domain-containing protein [Sphingomonas sp. GV3]|uniref:TetR/AcrR family transcriptional regulator n=1 Tax=Sphingomonas sp. GV3 TaxID=3040671 RepID=UPI00280C002D|nr:TetR/AcrR family transcriptional regulator C-terminal ligand-binding domain-containing protein [Sphingomonas sp. GV3]
MERKRSAENVTSQTWGAAVQRADVTEALTRAFFMEWARVGYADISLERVARLAGSGKAALYRRWPDKAAMMADLLSRIGLSLTMINDQGSLEDDVLAFLFAVRRVLRHPTIRRIVSDIHAQLERNPSLAAAMRPFQDARRARAYEIIDRAIKRGELQATIDRNLVGDLLAAPIYWRIAVLGQRADRYYVQGLARTIIGALRTMP